MQKGENHACERRRIMESAAQHLINRSVILMKHLFSPARQGLFQETGRKNARKRCGIFHKQQKAASQKLLDFLTETELNYIG